MTSLPPTASPLHNIRAQVITPTATSTLESHISSLSNLLHPFLQNATTSPTLIALYNLPSLQTLALFFALHTHNSIPVFLNSRWTTHEIRHALRTLPCTALIHPPEACTRIADLLETIEQPPVSLPLSIHPQYAFTSPSLPPFPCIQPPPTNAAAMFFTSGTTSKPKPVALTYASLHAQSRAKIDLLSLSEHSVYLHLAPLFHLGGFSSALAITLAHGTHIFPPPLHPSNPAHARTLLRCIQTFNVSFLVVVPAILTLLIDVAIRDKVVLPYVRTVLYGGARPAPAVLKDTALVCPNAEIVGAYGMTETASGMTFLRHSDAGETANTCAGSPLPHVEIRVRRRGDDGELGDEVGDGCRGEIVTRGVHVMEGYYAQREETHAAFMDGWMRTGDIGFFKGGLLHVLGRGGDVIRSGGESVFAGEVEDAILCHPHVREAAVVGLPHRILGEAVAAAVVLGSVGDVDSVLNDVKRQCRDVLAGYKCPRWIVQEERLPRTGTGKVMKNSLRQIMSARLKKRLAKL